MKFRLTLLLIIAFMPIIHNTYGQQDLVDTSMVLIKPSDPLIIYSGRTDIRNRNAPAFFYPGVTIRMQFTGDAFDMLLQDMASGDEAHTNYFDVVIDKDKPFVVKTSQKQKIYYLARSLDLREHTIEITKRTESSVGGVMVHGFRLRRGHKLLPLTDTPERKIEFIGNSLTVGYGNEVSIEAPPKGNPATGFHSINENNNTAWGALTCKALKAQYVCTAYSGRGVYRNNTGSMNGTMPMVYDYVNPDRVDAIWDHQRFVPNVIVIDLGTNDFAPGVPDSAEFCQAYISFIEKIRGIHPQTKIICVAGNAMSDYYPEGAQHWTLFRKYLNSVVKYANTKGDAGVFYFELAPQTPPYGEDWHPSNATHKKMSEAIIPFIKTVTGWN